MEKKFDGNYTRMLLAILNKSWRQHPTKQQLYGHLPHITKTIKVRRTRHAGHCWRSRDELVSDVLLWTPSHGRAKAGWPARTYIQQVCADTGCIPEDLPEAMDDKKKKVARKGQGYPCWWCDIMMTVKRNKAKVRIPSPLSCPYLACFYFSPDKSMLFELTTWGTAIYFISISSDIICCTSSTADDIELNFC